MSNFDFCAGEDWTVLANNAGDAGSLNDPSGFERAGFAPQQIDVLFSQAREATENILRDAPQAIKERMFTGTVPVYVANLGIGQGRPGLILRSPLIEFERVEGNKVKVAKHPLPSIQGVIFSIRDVLEGGDRLRSVIGHEMIHLATVPSTFSNSVAESLTSALESECCPDPDRTPLYDTWDKDRFRGTCGIRCDDYAQYRLVGYRDALYPALYLTAHQVFRQRTACEVWEICSALTAKAYESPDFPTYPQFRDFRDAVIDVIGTRDAKEVFGTIPMRKLEPGIQQFILPKKETADDVLTQVVSAEVVPNDSYLLWDGNNADQVQYYVRGVTQQCLVNVRIGSKGKAGTTLELSPVQNLRFRSVADFVQQQSGGRVRARDIKRIECRTEKHNFVLKE